MLVQSLVSMLANEPGEAGEDGPRACALPPVWRDQDGVLSDWFHSDTVLAV